MNDCANEDLDQKAYPPSLARFFIVHLMVSFLHKGNKDSDQACVQLGAASTGSLATKVSKKNESWLISFGWVYTFDWNLGTTRFIA